MALSEVVTNAGNKLYPGPDPAEKGQAMQVRILSPAPYLKTTTMKKELKDYLHLYLGSRCIMEADKFSGGKDYESIVDWSDIGYFHKVKQLILRPLSSMTEDEAKEIEATKAFQRPSPVHQIGMMVWTAESYRLLLSKGFDVFGLITDGLALNAETLK